MGKIHLLAVLSAIILLVQIANISAQDAELKGRLLTPEQGCGISKVANTKIIGGTEAKPGAFPWMALTGLKKNTLGKVMNFLSCGGSLITSRHVLTAARCVIPNLSFVRLGEHDLNATSDSVKDIQVIKAVKHPKYNEIDHTNDIAVLTLNRDVEFNDHIRPICLPLNKDLQSKSFVSTNPFVTGWGNLAENGERSNVLMQLQIPVLENKFCENEHWKVGGVYSKKQFSEIVLCAGNVANDHGACLGDSGGPLMLPIAENGQFPFYQIGIVSHKHKCVDGNLPGTYTRVSQFIDWIKTQLE